MVWRRRLGLLAVTWGKFRTKILFGGSLVESKASSGVGGTPKLVLYRFESPQASNVLRYSVIRAKTKASDGPRDLGRP